MTSPADDPAVRAAVLATITEAELRHMLDAEVNLRALTVAADVVLTPILGQSASTLAAWRDVVVYPREHPRLLDEDRRNEGGRVDDRMYPRAVCTACEAPRAPVVVRRDDSLVYRSHRVYRRHRTRGGQCSASRQPVPAERVVNWGTFEHLAPDPPEARRACHNEVTP